MSNYREQIGNLPNQFKVSENVISWEHKEIHLPANALLTVHFDNNKPNQFMIQNPNETIVHIGISRIPSAKTYEFRVGANSSRTFGRPTQTDVLYLLNKGNVEATLSLFSVYDKFDMSILQNTEVSMGDIKAFDGIITGFGNGVTLPSGSNNIGKVGVTSLPSLPAGNNTIGKVNISSLPSIPAGSNEIGKVIVTEMPEIQVSAGNGNINMLYADKVTEAINIDLSNRSVNYIVFLANDSEEEVYIYLKKPDGNGCGVYLKGGDTLNDLPFELASIRVTGENVSFRYLVGER